MEHDAKGVDVARGAEGHGAVGDDLGRHEGGGPEAGLPSAGCTLPLGAQAEVRHLRPGRHSPYQSSVFSWS